MSKEIKVGLSEKDLHHIMNNNTLNWSFNGVNVHLFKDTGQYEYDEEKSIIVDFESTAVKVPAYFFKMKEGDRLATLNELLDGFKPSVENYTEDI